MKVSRLIKKPNRIPLQVSSNRATSLLRGKESPSDFYLSEEKSSITPNNVANRLVQKRISIDRKIENMRKLKLEAEMKDMQSKPTILVRSRKLAEKAEKKLLDLKKTSTVANEQKTQNINLTAKNRKDLVIKTENEQKSINLDKDINTAKNESTKVGNDILFYHANALVKNDFFLDYSGGILKNQYKTDSKIVDLDEINEIEDDIKLLEKCLCIDTNNKKILEESKNTQQIKKINEQPNNTNTHSKFSIITKAKRELNSTYREPLIIQDDLQNPIHNVRVTPEINKIPLKNNIRRFIKKRVKSNVKSSSMQDLFQFKFNYRSLSPYHIKIARFNE